jgi:hypothetical protein
MTVHIIRVVLLIFSAHDSKLLNDSPKPNTAVVAAVFLGNLFFHLYFFELIPLSAIFLFAIKANKKDFHYNRG